MSLETSFIPSNRVKMARILFVDDDILTLDLMAKMAELLGHEAILSSSGNSALETYQREQPDVILIDLNLQDIDGIEVARYIRQIPGSQSTPIFILSAGVPAQVAELANQAGTQGCLEKPLGLDMLNRIVKTYLTS